MLNSATLLAMALFFTGLLLWLATMRMENYRTRLVQAIGRSRFGKILWVLMLTPPVVGLVAALMILLTVGPADPQLLDRLAHLSLVLGAWMAGTLGTLFFLFPYRLKLDFPLPALLAGLIAIPIAIYLTPLTRFLQVYLPSNQLGLGAAAGVFLIFLSELMLVMLKRSI